MPAKTLFISDLHLDPSRPQVTAAFARFLSEEAASAEALYILGDLFEYWVGDDQPHDGLESVFAGLAELTAKEVPVCVLHGNRDFLIGEGFLAETGAALLADGVVIDVAGEPTQILHGDTLCTDDAEYQAMRRVLRSSDWQSRFLSVSVEERIAQAQALREKSRVAQQSKTEYIMDVSQQAVEQSMRDAGVMRMIHGHTHRPAIHDFELDGQAAQRIVLGDWYDQGSVLSVSANEMTLSTLAIDHSG